MFVVIHILDYSLKKVNGFSLNRKGKKEGRIKVLYKKIKKICNSKGISISRLEKDCEIGNGTIRGWERSNPRIDSLKKVSDYLGIAIEDLLKSDPEPEEVK